MNHGVNEFRQRADEVKAYLRLLRQLETPGSPLLGVEGDDVRRLPDLGEWRVIGKAAAYLLIYNLVESSVRSGFDHLYGAIKADSCTYRTASEAIRSIWIGQKHRRMTRETASPMNYKDMAAELVDEAIQNVIISLDARRLAMSGNLDARRIRELCTEHDVALNTNKRLINSPTLQTVKDQRNALAHGFKSFAECGRDVTVDDLDRMAKEARVHVRGVLRDLRNHIRDKKYADRVLAVGPGGP